MIEVDGSRGEGGGQILRSSLSLAAVLGRDIRIFNIRAGRSEKGLKAQHLTGAKAVASICNASSKGLELGSTEFEFRPGTISGGDFRFDVGTAGSVTLVLQALMPLFPFASKKISLEISGGTDVRWSPPVDYLKLVTLPVLERMGFAMSLETVARGHYPKGGGLVRVTSTPSGPLSSLKGRQRGAVSKIVGVSHSLLLPRHVAERQAIAASRLITNKELPNPRIEVEASDNISQSGPGSGIVLSAKSENGAVLGGDCLGERGFAAEEVGNTAAGRLVEEVDSTMFLDRHMGDMIVPYIALAEGTSDVSISQITQHTLTNVSVAQLVAGVRFDSVGDLGKPGRLRVAGLGLTAHRAVSSPRESAQIASS